ncbi:response regulator transcription factor [Dyadobacter sp. LHD-138]|uniref:response regulator transcription factor n=1 Tax=Dyadobacter sp. LHD-138 TaxID=3071413 RepID=UPI0027E14901|nr:response regulator transcription factor [Dyadobacter sp. LHD-138]MDQ6480630.1 response regulator transcription factor [Dyadobacter sp. LHD-138]
MSTILIIDDWALVGGAIAALLETHYKDEYLIELRGTKEFLSSKKFQEIDLVVLGFCELTENEKFDLLRVVKLKLPAARVIVYDRQADASTTLSYLRSGANGCLCQSKILIDLIKCLETVWRGDYYVDSELLYSLLGKFQKGQRSYKNKHASRRLSPRQHEVALCLIRGMKTSFIAESLGLQRSTISTVKTNIFTKLGVNNILKLKEVMESR